MPSSPSHATLKVQRLQAEQKAQELRDAEIIAAFEETPITDPDYEFKCRVLSKQRLHTQKVRQHVGRKRYSIKVHLEKLERTRAEQEKLISELNKKEHYMLCRNPTDSSKFQREFCSPIVLSRLQSDIEAS